MIEDLTGKVFNMTEKIADLSEDIMKYTFRTLMPNSTVKAGVHTRMNNWAKRAQSLEFHAAKVPELVEACKNAQQSLMMAGDQINALKSELQRLQEIIYAKSMHNEE